MDVSSNYSQQQTIRERQKELEAKEQELLAAKNNVQKETQKVIQAEREKAGKDVVAISKESEAMVENMRKLTREQMLRNNAHTEEQMQKKAEEVANRLKELDLEGQSRIQNVQKSTMEKVADIGDRAQDSFYRPMQLNAQVKPDETGYTIQIPVVAHEAEKLFVTTEGKSVKLSLARSFANQTDTAPGVKNRTQSHQSVTEIIQLPDILDGKSIQREYSDGLLTLRIKRA